MSEEIGLYDLFERAYAHSANIHCRCDVSIEGLWIHESGERLRVEGFFDGEDCYRLRFMPTATGVWRYRVNLDGRLMERGAITCVPSEIKGPLRQDPQHPYHLIYSNGDPFYMLGNTIYNAVATYRQDRESLLEFLDYYAARRFNWNRFFLQQTTWPTLGSVVWPWGGAPEAPDFATFSLDTFRDAEGLIQEMASRDMIASVILLHPHDESLRSAGPQVMRVAKELIRYAVARLGSYWNVVWNIANEWQRAATFSYDDMDELGAYLHAIDPYQRLTSCHHYGRFEFYDKEWTDMASLQHRGLPHEINQWILQNRHFQKPVINEEYGYEGDNHAPPNDPDNVRHDHWAIAMAGGYGTYGDKTKGPKVAVYFSAVLRDAIGTVVPDALQYLQSFMASTGYRQMEPANEFLSECDPQQAFCLAWPGHEYIVYLVKGHPFRLNLTHVHAALSVRWYNPRGGNWLEREDMQILQSPEEQETGGEVTWRSISRSHRIRFDPPDVENDWVLYLVKR